MAADQLTSAGPSAAVVDTGAVLTVPVSRVGSGAGASGRADFAAALRGLAPRYWDRHPFHLRLHAGGCAPGEVRSWVANRWYYQSMLARKNAAIIAACPLPEVRQRWAERVAFFDGAAREDWLALGDAVGLGRDELLDERYVARGTRFAVDGYLQFCRLAPWKESVAAALTELFSPELMAARIVAWRRHYRWIKSDGYAYFENRIQAVCGDAEFTLDLVLTHCRTADEQRAALAALAFKCDVLGAILDAVDYQGGVP
ncbi:pyrroloquinoline-quinone synthase [Actinoplanes regularis]|nr:pyrroloquinoline-quinone synthase [Actinoplanes regularis]